MCNTVNFHSDITPIKTLVIGGAGYIGEYLVPMLIAAGRQVTVVGRSVTPRYNVPEGAIYISGDFGTLNFICDLLDSHHEVIHLAYATVPNTTVANPLNDLLQNLSPSVQLFEEVAKRALKLVFLSSGGTVYGEAIDIPIKESHPTNPISPYGITKVTLENYARLYAVNNGLKFVCIRPSNAYGVGQRPFVGQGFISTAIASIMQGNSIKIFGQEGTVRDYLYVSDLAAGIASALQHGHLSETYNLSSGVGLSNLDVVAAMTPCLREMGFHVHIQNLPERSQDVKINILDSAKLKLDTGWEPKIGFLDGLERTCGWMKRFLEKKNNF